MRAFLLFTIALLGLSSCKKDRLKDEKSILIGKWEWVYTVKVSQFASGNTISDTIFPSDVSDNYSVSFFKKGQVIFNENNTEKYNYRIKFQQFQITGSVPGCFVNNGDVYDLNIYLDGDDKNNLNGCVSSDSLMFFQNDFPFVNQYDQNCELCQTVHLNTFRRVD